MAVEQQLYYIATSKAKEIRAGGVPTYDWGTKGAWTKFKSPKAKSSKKVKYDSKAKSKAGAVGYGGLGGGTHHGTAIPAKAWRKVEGVDKQVDVRYYVRGYTKITNSAAMKKKKQMLKTVYTKAHPYQYRLQYKDKVVKTASYSTYANGMDYTFFGPKYWDGGVLKNVPNGYMLHPQTFEVTFSDVRRNYESKANNSDGRDNKGSYVLTNVRANVVTLSLEWQGLSANDGADLLDTLNPNYNGGKYNYLLVQFRDPSTGKVRNGTFYASDRKAVKYHNGMFQSITVTLTEV